MFWPRLGSRLGPFDSDRGSDVLMVAPWLSSRGSLAVGPEARLSRLGSLETRICWLRSSSLTRTETRIDIVTYHEHRTWLKAGYLDSDSRANSEALATALPRQTDIRIPLASIRRCSDISTGTRSTWRLGSLCGVVKRSWNGSRSSFRRQQMQLLPTQALTATRPWLSIATRHAESMHHSSARLSSYAKLSTLAGARVGVAPYCDKTLNLIKCLKTKFKISLDLSEISCLCSSQAEWSSYSAMLPLYVPSMLNTQVRLSK